MKDRRIITYIIIVSLLTVIGVSFGYFGFYVTGNGTGSIDVTTDNSLNLTFNVTKQLGFKLTQFNFIENGNNLSDSSIARATLAGGSVSDPQSSLYSVYLNITSNDFIYTTNDHKPELLLKVYDPSNTEITTLTGLTYSNTYHGFDITTKTGLIAITVDNSITSTSNTNPTVEDWTITVIANNLDTNQADNAGASFGASVLMNSSQYSS